MQNWICVAAAAAFLTGSTLAAAAEETPVILLAPKGRYRLQGTTLQFGWQQQSKSKGYRVSLYKLVKDGPTGKTLEVELKTVDLPPTQTITRDLDPGLPPGDYRWKVISWADGQTVLGQSEQDFAIEAPVFRMDQSATIMAGYSSSRLNYTGTQQTLSTLFSAGVAGPFIYYGTPVARSLDVDFKFSELQSVFRGLSTSYRTVDAGIHLKLESSRLMRTERLAFSPGIRVRYGSLPEILSLDAITVTTGTMTHVSVIPTLSFAYPVTAIAGLVGSVDASVPLMISGTTDPQGKAREMSISPHAQLGVRMTPITPWVIGLDAQYGVEKYVAGTDANPISVSTTGMTFHLSLGYQLRSPTVEQRVLTEL